MSTKYRTTGKMGLFDTEKQRANPRQSVIHSKKFQKWLILKCLDPLWKKRF
jgi:hypothetical protein